MNLRIHRSWKWVASSREPVRLGGPSAPLELVAVDVVEALVEGQWVPLPVVEDAIPENPRVAEQRRRDEERRTQMAETFRHFRVLEPSESFSDPQALQFRRR